MSITIAERNRIAGQIQAHQRVLDERRGDFGVLFRLLGDGPRLDGLKLGPEERESIRFFDGVRRAALEHRLRGQVVHLPLEGKRSRAAGAVRRRMGAVTGAPDYVVTGGAVGAWLEFKCNGNRLTSAQIDFQAWCKATGTRHYVCRSAEEGWLALVDLGVLDREAGR